jgi:adenylate cyclase
VRACGAALDMLALRKKMSEEWIATGRPPLVARTGVNSGVMMIGNMGSEYRLTYGVLGDNVNLASRLEGLNKEYRTSILIGENTVELIGDAFVLREVDVVRVVGKRKPVRIYELLAHAGTVLPAECQETLRCYAEARVAYRAQRWDEALALFERALVLTPDDGPSRVMAERCRSHADLPPAADWDGVFEAQKK